MSRRWLRLNAFFCAYFEICLQITAVKRQKEHERQFLILGHFQKENPKGNEVVKRSFMFSHYLDLFENRKKAPQPRKGENNSNKREAILNVIGQVCDQDRDLSMLLENLICSGKESIQRQKWPQRWKETDFFVIIKCGY